MPDPVVLLEAFGLAFGVGVIAALLTLWPRGSGYRPLPAVGVGAGLLLGAWALNLAPHYPPREDQDRFLLILIPAAVLAELAAGWLKRAGWIVRAVVAAGAAPVLLHGSVYLTDLAGPDSREWPPALARQILAGLGVALFGTWALLSQLSGRAAGASVPLSLALTCMGAGLVVMMSGYATGGQLGLPLAGGLVGVAVVTTLSGRSDPRGAVGVGVVGLFGLLVTARFFAGLSTTNAVLLFAAPLLGWAPELPGANRLGPRVRGGLRVILVMVPVVVALTRARETFVADSAGPRLSPAAAHEPALQDYLDFGK